MEFAFMLHISFLFSVLLLLETSATNLRYSRRLGRLFNIVRLNPLQRFNIGIQITVPVSFFMPNFGRSGKQSRSLSTGQDNWPWSSGHTKSALSTCPTERVELEDYLYMLQIDVESCQRRFICEIASDPKKFSPISEIFLKKLAFNAKLDKQNNFDLHNGTVDGLLRAARMGVNLPGQCHRAFKDCPVTADSMVDTSLLWVWQLVSRVTNIRFSGETDNSVFDHS